MNRLLEIGFELAGHWQLVDGELSLELLRHGSQSNILYAFVIDGEVKYVGKTIQPLSRRLYGYKKPGETQSTNIKNNRLIKDALRNGAVVDILALPDSGLLHFGSFHINLAAGLEDNIISVLEPEWNGRIGAKLEECEEQGDGPQIIDAFSIVLHQTYFQHGFFNVPAANAKSFGGDGLQIEIFCGDSPQPMLGIINRKSNQNRSPRVMGGNGLRDWFQRKMTKMQRLSVEVLSPQSIHIRSE